MLDNDLFADADPDIDAVVVVEAHALEVDVDDSELKTVSVFEADGIGVADDVSDADIVAVVDIVDTDDVVPVLVELTDSVNEAVIETGAVPVAVAFEEAEATPEYEGEPVLEGVADEDNEAEVQSVDDADTFMVLERFALMVEDGEGDRDRRGVIVAKLGLDEIVADVVTVSVEAIVPLTTRESVDIAEAEKSEDSENMEDCDAETFALIVMLADPEEELE